MEISPRLPRETAREYALRILKRNIVSLSLAPGSMVSENELSEAMGLSRTPIREALIDLSRTQIVEILPQRGSRVSLIDYELVEESRFLRLVLEKAVVELACERADTLDFSTLEENLKLQSFYLANDMLDRLMEADDAFHRELFRLTRKQNAYQLLSGMTLHFDRVRNLSLMKVRETKFVSDHTAIYEAVRAGKTQEALDAVTKHLSRYKIDEVAIRQQYPQYIAE